MTTRATKDETPVSRGHRNLLLASAGMTYLLITMGGIVCVTGSGRGCPDWPGCFGNVVPPAQADAVIEYLHRLIAGLTSPIIIAAAIVSWRRSRSADWITRPVTLAIAFLVAVIIFGAFAIITGIPPWIAAIDLGSALVVLALLLTASVAAFSLRSSSTPRDRPAFSSSFSRLSLWTTGGALLVLASSVLVVESGSISRCLGWPVYGEPLSLADWQGWLGMARRLVALATSVSVIVILVQAWRTQRGQPAVMRAAAFVGVVFVIETVLGILIGTGNLTLVLRVVYVATTAAFWASLVILTAVAGLAEPVPATGSPQMRRTASPV